MVDVQDIHSFYRLNLDLAGRAGGNLRMMAFGTPFKQDDVVDVCTILGMKFNALEPDGWKFSCRLKRI